MNHYHNIVPKQGVDKERDFWTIWHFCRKSEWSGGMWAGEDLFTSWSKQYYGSNVGLYRDGLPQ